MSSFKPFVLELQEGSAEICTSRRPVSQEDAAHKMSQMGSDD
jgi:hypothetical protein